MASKCLPCSVLEAFWRPFGSPTSNLETDLPKWKPWKPCGGRLEAIWRPHGSLVETTWKAFGTRVSKWPPNAFHFGMEKWHLRGREQGCRGGVRDPESQFLTFVGWPGRVTRRSSPLYCAASLEEGCKDHNLTISNRPFVQSLGKPHFNAPRLAIHTFPQIE